MKNSPLPLVLFIAVLLIGTFALYAVHALLAYTLVSLTGWGWLFASGIRYWPIFLFWLIMAWIYWRKLRNSAKGE